AIVDRRAATPFPWQNGIQRHSYSSLPFMKHTDGFLLSVVRSRLSNTVAEMEACVLLLSLSLHHLNSQLFPLLRSELLVICNFNFHSSCWSWFLPFSYLSLYCLIC
ncbi:hypothetical protein PIB30_034218, partial [Stylosanthes scabra]|nr:hypothetical protein [Stylosanthes scabra]